MIDRASLPDFELPATGNQRFQLSAFKGHPFVLYFYPRDNTPGAPTIRSCPGRIARAWCGVKVPGHAQAALDYVGSAGL